MNRITDCAQSRISVIVPMYNSIDYISRCLDSIASQIFSDIEVIVIDDGSQDGSLSVANDFAKKDKRIHVIHQDNHGLVYSRKVGIKEATGEYILFVDSDDWIDTDMLDKLFTLAVKNGADVVCSGARKIFYDENGICSGNIQEKNIAKAGVYRDSELERLKQNLFCIEDYCSMAVLPFLWNKLWKKEIIEPFVLEADEQVTVGEDVAIGFPAILSAKCVVLTDEAYYYYCQNSQSMMRMAFNEEDEYKNACRLISYLENKCRDHGYYEMIKTGLGRFCDNQLFTRAYSVLNRKKECRGLFPFVEEMPESIVIYGAGEFGRAIYKYAYGKAQVTAWIDQNADVYRSQGLPVISLKEYECNPEDTVIIAVFREKSVRIIEDALVQKGIDPENIYSVRRAYIRRDDIDSQATLEP